MSTSDLYILISSFNNGETISASIDSIKNIDWKNGDVKVLLYVDGSTYETKKRVINNKIISKTIISERNKGKAVGLNYLFQEMLKVARDNDYFLIFDSDDTYETIQIEMPTTDVVIYNYHVFGGGKYINSVIPKMKSIKQRVLSYHFDFRTNVHLNAMLISVKILRDELAMDIRLLRAQDTDFAMRIFMKCKSVSSRNQFLFKYNRDRKDLVSIMRLRLRTIYYRSVMLRKNSRNSIYLLSVPLQLFYDIIKIPIEILLHMYSIHKRPSQESYKDS